ncbi:MAG: membrane protein insertase YidC [Acidobacteriota bacterium]
MEKRALIAALLSGLVLLLWFTLFPSPKPSPTPVVATPAAGSPTGGATSTAGGPAGAPGMPGKGEPAAQPVVAGPPAARAEQGEEIPLNGDGWNAVIDSRGAVVRSLVLTGYRGENGEPLDLVSTVGPRPLTMTALGPWNHEPYVVEHNGATVTLRWSDGQGNWVEKDLTPGKGRYTLELEVRSGGTPGAGGVVIAVGRDHGAPKAGGFGSVGGVVRVGGKLDRLIPAKLETPKELSGNIEFAGVEDHYFLTVLLPESPLVKVQTSAQAGTVTPVAEVAAFGSGGVVKGLLYGGPKEHRVLVGYGRGLDETLSFGLFGVLSVAFLAALRWIHSWTANWGVAIIVLTAGIRLLLFPLTHKSTVAMRRMQALQPKMKAIQERYKERAKKDPQVRARMNQEMMALYKQEGVNPMGGCLPTLVQLPILWALYTLFANAIELRQAPFLLWIHDLSIPDTLVTIPLGTWSFPLRPLAVLMGASMFLQQKIAPQVGDPTQRRMFMMMPFIFTIMFYGFPSGLVLYWLVNNLLTIGQQLITERILRNTQTPPAAA